MSSCSAASRREAPPSTRAITRMRMSAEYAFGMVRPPDESMPPDSPIYRSLRILRFYSARTCSRTEAWTMGADSCTFPTFVSRHREPIREDRNVFLDCAGGFFLQHGILSQLRYLRGDI